jgi:ribulose-phosphate 3-epimerase
MIIPAILEKDITAVQTKLNIIDKTAKIIQIDLSDGLLVAGNTFTDIYELERIRTHAQIQVHLMVLNPMPYLESKVECVKSICAQVEGKFNKTGFIEKAKEMGYEVGMSLNSETSADLVEGFADRLDYVQFMTVIPGKQGEEFIPEVLEKIKSFRQKHPEVTIQTDGGANADNLKEILRVGVDHVVIGSAIFGSHDPKEKYNQLCELEQINNKNSLTSLTTVTRAYNKIAFLGGAAWHEYDQVYRDAFATAKLLAENGYEIVDGGGPGVMRAATQGAHAGGGKALAITYHPNKPKRHYEGVDKTNGFDEEIITLDYFDRTKVMLQNTDVHIVFNGSLGTLSEFGMTWISSWIHEPDSKPIILFGNFWKDVIDVLGRHMIVEKAEKEMVVICTTPSEVLAYLERLERNSRKS